MIFFLIITQLTFISSMTNNFIASASATTIAEILTIPICTIRTNYQTNLSCNLYNCIKDIYKKNGICSFYNASPFAIFGQVISLSSRYTIYEYLKTINKMDNIYYSNIINGSLSGVLGGLIVHPIDVFKTTKQLNNSIIKEFNIYGFKYLYRGFSKSIIKSISLFGIMLPVFDFTNEKFNNVILASVLTGIITTCSLYPIDFIKVRHMANQNLFLGYNPFIYYRGLHLSLIRNIPHLTITMFIINKIKLNKDINK